jgi:CTP:phosphocholine cytidylyltransferase-like protein
MTVGILLVGGLGTRLKPLTNESPKPMLPVAGLPVTEHQILAAKRADRKKKQTGFTKRSVAPVYFPRRQRASEL